MKKLTIYCLAIFSGCLCVVSSCEDERVDPDEVITLEFDDSKTYKANGTTTIPLTIRIAPNADSSYRSVTLTTDGGKFTDSNTLVLTMSLQNEQTVMLTAGTKPGTFAIRAAITNTPNYYVEKQITLTALKKSEVILKIDHPDLEDFVADGESEALFAVSLGVKTALRFQTETGTFREFAGIPSADLTVQPDLQNKATAIFRFGQTPGTYVLAFKTTEPAYDSLILFEVKPAYADDIIIQLETVQVDSANGQLPVNIILERVTGKVSTGVSVKFESDAGHFSHQIRYTEEDGTVSTTFQLEAGEVAVGESITIRAITPQASGVDKIATRVLKVK